MITVKIRYKNGDIDVRTDVQEIHFNHNNRNDIAFEEHSNCRGMNINISEIAEFEAYDDEYLKQLEENQWSKE